MQHSLLTYLKQGQSYDNISSFRQNCLDFEKDSQRKSNTEKILKSWKTTWVLKNKTRAFRPKFGLFLFFKTQAKNKLEYNMPIFLSPHNYVILRHNFLQA